MSTTVTQPVVEPKDDYNETLTRNAHPADWVQPEPAERYDMLVIGGGTAGLVTALIAAGLGARVALVEKHLLGGDCLNFGCVPSKAVIRAARAVADVRDSSAFGVFGTENAQVDFGVAMERMRRLRAHISRHDSAERLRREGIDVFLGAARFVGRDRLAVGDLVLRFKRATIATGARSAAPPIPGLAETGFLTNESVFSLTETPKRLGVIGGGPIGSELAQSFARFGTRVVQLEMGEHILPRDDRDAALKVQTALRRDGVELLTRATVQKVASSANGKTITYEREGQQSEVTVDEILVAIGRAPNVEGLELEAAGVEYDPRRGVIVDDRLRTANKRIFAAGDICTPFKFTHTADAMAGIVVRNALFFGRAKVSELNVPWATYTDPELAHVGLSPLEARSRGIEIDIYEQPFADVDRSLLEGDDEGLAKVYVKKGRDEIVGATVVGRHAGEMISEITLAMNAGAGLGKIAATIHPYPTQSEVWRKLANQYMRTRLTPGRKKILERIIAWRH